MGIRGRLQAGSTKPTAGFVNHIFAVKQKMCNLALFSVLVLTVFPLSSNVDVACGTDHHNNIWN